MTSKTINADPAELAKFQQLASQWWDKSGKFKPLHDINPLRRDWIDRMMPLKGRRVLDVGCGGGILSESMAELGAEVTGIDLAGKPLQVARLHALESGAKLRYLESSAEAMLEAEPASFDVVTCLEMLEHVPDPAATVAACAGLAKPGGWIFFSTINRNPKAFLFAIVGAPTIANKNALGFRLMVEKKIQPPGLARPAQAATVAAGSGTCSSISKQVTTSKEAGSASSIASAEDSR